MSHTGEHFIINLKTGGVTGCLLTTTVDMPYEYECIILQRGRSISLSSFSTFPFPLMLG
jgi:hypothetical protein